MRDKPTIAESAVPVSTIELTNRDHILNIFNKVKPGVPTLFSYQNIMELISSDSGLSSNILEDGRLQVKLTNDADVKFEVSGDLCRVVTHEAFGIQRRCFGYDDFGRLTSRVSVLINGSGSITPSYIATYAYPDNSDPAKYIETEVPVNWK